MITTLKKLYKRIRKYCNIYLHNGFQYTEIVPRSWWDSVAIQENRSHLVQIIETQNMEYLARYRNNEMNVHYVRIIVYDLLVQASNTLPNGYKLVIIEGWRSLERQTLMREKTHEMLQTKYPEKSESELIHQVDLRVARPSLLSNHHCGGAVDVTLSYNGDLVDMGTEIQDVFDAIENIHMFSYNLTPKQIENRTILRIAMQNAGFVYYPGEWWHYCYGDRMWAVYTKRKSCLYGFVEPEVS